MVRLLARVLGTFELELDGHHLTGSSFGRRSARHLVQLLLLRPGHRVRREEAVDALWPDLDPEHAATNLRKALHFARHALGEAVLRADAQHVWLSGAGALDLDLDRFERAVGAIGQGGTDAGSQSRDADLALGARELLPDEPYEDWLVPLRSRLAERWAAATLAAAEAAEVAEDWTRASALAAALVDRDPANEPAVRVLARIALRRGHRHEARRLIVACRAATQEAFGVDPEPETLTLLAGTEAARSPGRRSPAGALAGRQAEHDAIEASLDVREGRVAIVLRGAAGIGKTSLLEVALDASVAEGFRAVLVRGIEASPDTPLAALGDAVRPGFGNADEWPEPARSASRTLLAGGPPPQVAFASQPALVAGIVDGLARGFGDRIVLAADDVQWLDDASVSVVAAAWASGVATRLVIALRDGERTSPRLLALLDDLRRTGATELEVGPIPRAHLGSLVHAELGDAATPRLLDATWDLAAGNPLFCLEILRAARVTGSLAQRPDGRWDVARDAQQLGLPASLRRVVDLRLATADPTTAEVLACLAELGSAVPWDTLARALPEMPEDRVLAALDDGIRLLFVVEDGVGYSFAHPLFRAALRGSLPASRRAALHLAVAVALAGDGDREPSLTARTDPAAVARHALMAEAAGRHDARELAVRFGIAAVERLAAVFDHAAVSELVPQVLSAWERLPAPQPASYRPIAMLVRGAQALTALGREAEAATLLAQARAVAANPDELALAGREQAWLPYRHGELDTALELLRTVRRELPAEADHAIATVDQQIGWIRMRQGAGKEAIAVLEACLAVFERTEDDAWTLQLLDKLGNALVGEDDVRSERLLRRSIALARARSDLRAELPATLHLVTTCEHLGEYGAARAALARSLEIAPIVGERYLEAMSCRVGAAMEERAGEPRAALDLYGRELAILAEIGGNAAHEATSLAAMAAIHSSLGDRSSAMREADAARSRAASTGADWRAIVADRLTEAGLTGEAS